jgi:hypothetical protein
MTWTIIKITKIDDHQKLSAPIRVAKLFAKTATVFAAESVSLYGNEVNTYTYIQLSRPSKQIGDKNCVK